MTSGFDQWSGAAGSIADSYGLDRNIFFGLIQTESGWNPNASAAANGLGTSAFGFTQLVKGTAKSLGVDAHDPMQNLQGGAKYLSGLLHQYGGDYTKALAAYHDGPLNIGRAGLGYAKTVLETANSYLKKGGKLLGLSGSSGDAIDAALNLAVPGLGTVAGMAGVGGDSCGWICQLEKWITNSGFFQRLALAILAFIILAAAFYLMNRTEINTAVKTAAMA